MHVSLVSTILYAEAKNTTHKVAFKKKEDILALIL